jgi:hypothetical protein
MKLIKIDPQTKTVEAIETPGGLQDMYRLIGCRFIDVCARQDNGDCLTVDDESLDLEPQPPAFIFGDFDQPIHGIAILSGTNDEGETTEPIMSLEEAIQSVQWLGEIHTQPFLMVIDL